MEFGKSCWRTFEQGIEKEWLVTNGIGGFASSTVIGANTRRYHGLLVASLNPPVNRHLILSKVDESIFTGSGSYNLYSFKTSGFVMKGYHHLQRFVMDTVPTYIYSVEDVFIEKKVSMVYGENTTVILYHILNGRDSIKLRLTPLVNFRDYHHNSSRPHMFFTQRGYGSGTHIKPYDLDLDITLHCSEGTFQKQEDCWFSGMYYPMEEERGLNPVEDHYIPGFFDIVVGSGEEKYITLIVSTEDKLLETDGRKLLAQEEDRLAKLMQLSCCRDEFVQKLVLAADKFIVYRKSTDARTIIAGYPWFTDWGRDSMIALPGLTLASGRFDDAKQILHTFSKYITRGLVPNVFPDEGQEPSYNSVDSSLWYFEAVSKYLRYTGDLDFVGKDLYKPLKEIINTYVKGTIHDIRMDGDFLITAGNKDTQLTWMDVKIGDYTVTPRNGKAVEINALWYNALMIVASLAGRFGEDDSEYLRLAGNVKYSFVNTFWNGNRKCLYDVVSGDSRDDSIRPNQIFAVSLSNAVVDGDIAESIVDTVWKKLYTSYGLRSLDPEDPSYIGEYRGDPYRRDTAYHQGTVWAWLAGHFITAFMKVNGYSEEARQKAMLFVQPFKDHLRDGCIGSISEIFDGDEPLTPRGCFAQAWSVAEVLRAYVEDVLRVKVFSGR